MNYDFVKVLFVIYIAVHFRVCHSSGIVNNQLVLFFKYILAAYQVTTVVGGFSGDADGIGTNAKIYDPREIAITANGQLAYFVEANGGVVRKVDLQFSTVTKLVGKFADGGFAEGYGTNAIFSNPRGLTLSSDETFLLVADTNNFRIRHVMISTKIVTTLAGTSSAGHANGVGTNAFFDKIQSISLSPDDSFALVTEYTYHVIRIVNMTTRHVYLFAGAAGTGANVNGPGLSSRFQNPTSVAITWLGVNLVAYVVDGTSRIRRIMIERDTTTGATYAGMVTTLVSAEISWGFHISAAPDGSFLLLADMGTLNIKRVNTTSGAIVAIAGSGAASTSVDGVGLMAAFHSPFGTVVSSDMSFALVSEVNSDKIRKIKFYDPPTPAPTGTIRSSSQ